MSWNSAQNKFRTVALLLLGVGLISGCSVRLNRFGAARVGTFSYTLPTAIYAYNPGPSVITDNSPVLSGTFTSFTISPDLSLATGLTFSSTTGVISGTPTTASEAINYTVTATGTSGTKTATVNIRSFHGYIVNTTSDASDNAVDTLCATAAGECSIRAAVQAISSQALGYRMGVLIPDGTYTIATFITVGDKTDIEGTSVAGTVLDAGGTVSGTSDYMFSLNTVDVTFSKFTIQNCMPVAGADGSAMRIAWSTVTVTDVKFTNNISANSGTVRAGNSTFNCTRCEFTSNSAAIDSGAISYVSSSGTISDSTFTSNSAPTTGAIQFTWSTGTISGSRFMSNSSTGEGGALGTWGTTLTVDTSYFEANNAPSGGAVIMAANLTNVTFTKSIFKSNIGRGIYFWGTSMLLDRVLMDGNAGNGITISTAGTSTIQNSTIVNGTDGPAIMDEGGGLVTILNSTVAANNSTWGGWAGGVTGWWQNGGANISMKNTIVSGNTQLGAPSDCTCQGCTHTSAGNNISLGGAAECNFIAGGDLPLTDPLLGTLADNNGTAIVDGHVIQSLLPGVGSLAIDGGTNTGCPAVDARDVARPIGGTCDIGATEQ